MFLVFAFKATKFTKSKLIYMESQANEMYGDIIRQHGAPNKTVTDNARVCTGKRYTTINRRFCIEIGLSVPHHRYKKCAQSEGGNLKYRMFKLFHHTHHIPIQYWCFGFEYMNQVGLYIYNTSLDGRYS